MAVAPRIDPKSLFSAEEGRLGVVVTFLGLLTLAKEQLVEIVQEAPLAAIYVKSLATRDAPADLPDSEFDDAAGVYRVPRILKRETCEDDWSAD